MGKVSPGKILKRCREYHKISISDASKSTKISSNVLLDIENDKIKSFDNIAYLKGFIRVYASYLGLNPDNVLSLFENYHKEHGLEPGYNTFTTRYKFFWHRLIVPVVLFCIIVIVYIVCEW